MIPFMTLLLVFIGLGEQACQFLAKRSARKLVHVKHVWAKLGTMASLRYFYSSTHRCLATLMEGIGLGRLVLDSVNPTAIFRTEG